MINILTVAICTFILIVYTNPPKGKKKQSKKKPEVWDYKKDYED